MDLMEKFEAYKSEANFSTINKAAVHLLGAALETAQGMPLSSVQVRAARVFLSWDRAGLADRAGISSARLAAFEDGAAGLDLTAVLALKSVLEEGGVAFTRAGGIDPM